MAALVLSAGVVVVLAAAPGASQTAGDTGVVVFVGSADQFDTANGTEISCEGAIPVGISVGWDAEGAGQVELFYFRFNVAGLPREFGEGDTTQYIECLQGGRRVAHVGSWDLTSGAVVFDSDRGTIPDSTDVTVGWDASRQTVTSIRGSIMAQDAFNTWTISFALEALCGSGFSLNRPFASNAYADLDQREPFEANPEAELCELAVPAGDAQNGAQPEDGDDETGSSTRQGEGEGAGVGEGQAQSGNASEDGPDGGGVSLGVLALIAVLIAAGLIGAALLVLRRARSGQVRPEQHDEEESKEVTLELTYPAGGSPYVFQYGWIFGARAIVAPGTPDETDISDTVQWYGDATFDPPVGQTSRPSFEHRGGDMVGQRATKTITLKVEVDGISTETTTKVNVTGTAGYAGVGDLSKSPADAHGCPACPHPAVGPITAGSATVMIPSFGGGDLVPAARVGDSGVHAACCGPNKMMAILDGDSSVLIDGKHAARMGSTTQHCGGLGKIITGSSGGGP